MASSAVRPSDGRFKIQDCRLNRKVTTTPVKHDEIIDDLEGHIHDGLKRASLNDEGAQAGVPVPPSEPGKIVFVYRPTTVDTSSAGRGAAVQPAPAARSSGEGGREGGREGGYALRFSRSSRSARNILSKD